MVPFFFQVSAGVRDAGTFAVLLGDVSTFDSGYISIPIGGCLGYVDGEVGPLEALLASLSMWARMGLCFAGASSAFKMSKLMSP